eukprot:s562_g6.t1
MESHDIPSIPESCTCASSTLSNTVVLLDTAVRSDRRVGTPTKRDSVATGNARGAACRPLPHCHNIFKRSFGAEFRELLRLQRKNVRALLGPRPKGPPKGDASAKASASALKDDANSLHGSLAAVLQKHMLDIK